MTALFFYIVSSRIFTPDPRGCRRFAEAVHFHWNASLPWSLTAMFLLPQVLIALIGGWFNTRYRLTLRIERRQIGAADPA